MRVLFVPFVNGLWNRWAVELPTPSLITDVSRQPRIDPGVLPVWRAVDPQTRPHDIHREPNGFRKTKIETTMSTAGIAKAKPRIAAWYNSGIA